MGTKLLKPIKETTEDFEEIERKIRSLLREQIYVPLMRVFAPNAKALTNAKPGLADAIKYGRVQFYRGTFSGRFNAQISKELKALGARWDRQTGTWKLSQTSLPPEIRTAITASRAHFERQLDKIDEKLAAILPGEIADKLKVDHLFDSTLWKVEREFAATLKGLTIAPQLTKEQRRTIALEWQNNLKLYIKDFTQKETAQLRKDMQASVFAGNRYETAVKTIAKSYDTSVSKAKFLARQETGLLMAKFKEVRYKDVGIKRYKWRCVSGTGAHPVRPTHKICDGKIFSWDNPSELNNQGLPKSGGVHKPGDNKNPGEDYNCRCTAVPIVEFSSKEGK